MNSHSLYALALESVKILLSLHFILNFCQSVDCSHRHRKHSVRRKQMYYSTLCLCIIQASD